MRIRYSNRWAFIIGGSAGIGLALAKEFLTRKSKVLIIARNEKVLKKTGFQLQSQFPDSEIRWLAADATDEAELKSHFRQLAVAGIIPYFLLNCAGRALPGYFENITTQQLEDTFRLNVVTVWNSIQAALPHMKEGGGFIINTSSIAGFIGIFGYSDYSVSKFGLIGLSEVLRSELAPQGIHVSVLCPPDTDTPGYQEENKSKPAETLAISANTKLMSAEAVARGTLRELEKGHFLLLINSESKLTWVLKRFLPSLLYKIIQKDVSKIQNKR